MADKKISELIEEATLEDNDLFVLSIDNGNSTYDNRKIKASNVKEYVGSGVNADAVIGIQLSIG